MPMWSLIYHSSCRSESASYIINVFVELKVDTEWRKFELCFHKCYWRQIKYSENVASNNVLQNKMVDMRKKHQLRVKIVHFCLLL